MGPGPSVGDWFKQPISPNLKAHSLSAAWGGVVLVTLAIKPAYLLTAPAFPLGLLALNVAGCKKLNETAAAIHSRVG